MILTTYSEKIEGLLNREPLLNKNIFGIIENVKSEKLKIYVDDVDDVGIVFINAGYMNFVYTDDLIKVKLLIPLIDSLFRYIGFSGVKKEIFEEITKLYVHDWSSPCYLYNLPDEVEILTVDTDYIGSISIEDAKEIDHYYTYQSAQSMSRIEDDILNRPSSCVKIDGELRSWLLLHDDNSMGIMYTKEEYRKMGYALELTLDLIVKLREQKKTPYLQIVTDNAKSQKLAEKSGFKRCGEVCWFGILNEKVVR